ncbi:hypothetical protein ACFLZD_01185 [Candidatus Neomarinimicrobiota bacterium]
MTKQSSRNISQIPKSLKVWFVIHFIVDILFAIPLIFFPIWLLGLFGLSANEAVMARLVGAALVGIGGVSVLAKNMTKDSFNTMLTLKLLWSSSAVFGFLISLFAGAPKSVWLFVFIFAVFFFIWLYYKNRIK